MNNHNQGRRPDQYEFAAKVFIVCVLGIMAFAIVAIIATYFNITL